MSADRTGSNPPEWDQSEADRLIGRYVLIGVTHVAADGETVTAQAQYHGRILIADLQSGISVACEGRRTGETFRLPPDLTVFQAAGPGAYTLRSTGEVVTDPDLLATWSVFAKTRPEN